VFYGPEIARPDLPIPLAPLGPIGTTVRSAIIGLREPMFARAHRITLLWALAALTLIVAVRFLLDPGLRVPATAVGATMALYIAVRMAALRVFERWQRGFEPVWLDTQTQVLRKHPFEVLRLIVRGSGGDRATSYDLTRPGDVERLLRRQESERANGTVSSAVVEFGYRPGPGEGVVVDRARRDLTDLRFMELRRKIARPRVRFPEATYGGRPPMTRREQGWPSRTTYWALSGPVCVTVGVPASSVGGGVSPAGSGLSSRSRCS
jgi:hypothetical protein